MSTTPSRIPPADSPAPKPTRRTFTAEYKARILADYEAAPDGERGAVLRRERLYHSHIIDWRAARDAGALAALRDARTSARRWMASSCSSSAMRRRAAIGSAFSLLGMPGA